LAFNINDYETVESRLEKFITDFPDFRIDTELVAHTETRFIVRAAIYRTYLDAVPFATGLAYEDITERGVNQTSALENCETSAIGRSLAQAGYAAKGKRPSQSEMQKVVKGNQEAPKPLYGKVGSKSAAIEMALRQDIKDNPWTAPVKNEDPVKWTVEDVAKELNAEKVDETFDCRHGKMLRKEGTNARGAYYGFVCVEKNKAQQCPSKWAKATSNGKWYFPDDKE
jgi:hypothetical protein